LQPNEFQSLNPIGGVSARPLLTALAGAAVASPDITQAAATVAAAKSRELTLRASGRVLPDTDIISAGRVEALTVVDELPSIKVLNRSTVNRKIRS
jgi:hypothetical protein